MRKSALTLFLTLCILYLLQGLYFYPQLPETVAMHFAADGQPDSWSSKDTFLNFYLATGAFCMLLFMGISFGMKYIPVSLINFPNKSYWLSPERRQNTLDFFSGYFLWFASATILLLFDIMNQSIRVHIGEVGKLPHPMMSLGLYLGFTVVWCAVLLVKFGRKQLESKT